MDIFNSLMGAVVVALVTASIFIFQRKIEADDEKNRVIYEKKLSLYEQIASKLNEIIQDNKISEKELQNLQLFSFKVVLIAGPKAAEKFNEMLVNLRNDSGSDIEDSTKQAIVDFITLSERTLTYWQTLIQNRKLKLVISLGNLNKMTGSLKISAAKKELLMTILEGKLFRSTKKLNQPKRKKQF